MDQLLAHRVGVSWGGCRDLQAAVWCTYVCIYGICQLTRCLSCSLYLHQSVHQSIKPSCRQSIPPGLQNQKRTIASSAFIRFVGDSLSSCLCSLDIGQTPSQGTHHHHNLAHTQARNSHITSVHAGWHKRASEAMIQDVRRLSCPSAAGFWHAGFLQPAPVI